jgi:hypothetical protein
MKEVEVSVPVLTGITNQERKRQYHHPRTHKEEVWSFREGQEKEIK